MRPLHILVPYHLGEPGVGPGRGPARLVAAHAVGGTLETQTVQVRPEGWGNEAKRCFEVIRAVQAKVAGAVAAGRFPVVWSGNCNATIGAMPAFPEKVGLVWMDAHGDLNTPATTRSGYFEGMPLAVLLGRAWESMARDLPGWRPLAEDQVLHVGARDLDPPEREFLQASRLGAVPVEDLRRHARDGAGIPALQAFTRRNRSFYLHVDVDVLDPSQGVPSHNAVPGGPTVDEVAAFVRTLARTSRLAGLGVASYNPEFDRDGRALASTLRLVDTILS